MTASVFTSKLQSDINYRKNYKLKIYQVDVYGEDNESMSFEVSAKSMAAATAVAERRANESMTDIQYINVTAI